MSAAASTAQTTGNSQKLLWLIIGGLTVSVLVWFVCKQMSKNDQLLPLQPGNKFAQCAPAMAAQASAYMASNSLPAQPAAVGPKPYGNNAPAYDPRFPSGEDPDGNALFPKVPTARGCGGEYDCVQPANQGCGDKWGYQLNVDHLMPASWRGPSNCAGLAVDDTQWSKYAPSKESFDRYITAAGSARLAVNTRSPLARQVGIPLLLRPGPPIPISTKEHEFNDSSFRQDTVFNSVGYYPGNDDC